MANHRSTIPDIEPDFIGKHEMARHMCVVPSTIDYWISKGSMPPPHSYPGLRHPVWLRRHYKSYRDNRVWPTESYHRS